MMLTLLGCLAVMGGFAGKTFKAHIKSPGTLRDYLAQIPVEQRRTITKMIISGKLNGRDASLLRHYTGYGASQERTRGQVTSLDLRNAEFVAGGGQYLFYLSSRQISNYRNTIPAFLFRNCHLEEIILPEKLERIEEGAFEYSDVKRVVIPPTVKFIGNYAFNSCWNLEEIRMSPELDYLGMMAINDLTKLRRLEFGEVKRAANHAIGNCTVLSEIVFNGRLKRHEILVEDCPELQVLDFRKGLDEPQRANMVNNCPKLKKVAVKKDKEPLEFYLY